MSIHKKRTAIISGAAGHIGFEILKGFCKDGMNVAIFSSSKKKALDTAERLSGFGNSCLPIGCDVTNSEMVHIAMAEVKDHFGGIDVLISMQGWPPQKEKINEITDEYWDGVISSHLTGSFRMLQQVTPYLEKSLAPRVVFLSSYGATTGYYDEGLPYVVAKGGINSLTYCAARMLASKKITVNCVATGGIINDSSKIEIATDLIKKIPLGKLCTPEDVYKAVRYLASDESGFVTGEVMNVSGGLAVG